MLFGMLNKLHLSELLIWPSLLLLDIIPRLLIPSRRCLVWLALVLLVKHKLLGSKLINLYTWRWTLITLFNNCVLGLLLSHRLLILVLSTATWNHHYARALNVGSLLMILNWMSDVLVLDCIRLWLGLTSIQSRGLLPLNLRNVTEVCILRYAISGMRLVEANGAW